MKELVIYIDSCYINSNKENIQDIVHSINKNIGITDYSYYILVQDEETKDLYESLLGTKIFQIKILEKDTWWANNFNMFVDDCKLHFKRLMMTHDDLTIDTPNFYKIYLNEIKDIPAEELGFVGFSNVHYNKIGNLTSNSMREGIAKDRLHSSFGNCRIYECHTGDINNLAWPKETSVVWAVFHMLSIISFENILKIHPLTPLCNWGALADEDCNLEAMLAGMDNLWIPHIEYTHPLRRKPGYGGPHRAYELLKKNFSKKWGVSWAIDNYTDQDIKVLLDKYPNTRIQKFANRHTYEYISAKEYYKNGGHKGWQH